MSTQDVFPEVPAEILREVLEFAAWSSSETALTLALVSSYVRHWTLPVIYDTVALSTAPAVNSFLQATAEIDTPAYRSLNPITIRKYVKKLGIFTLGPLPYIGEILTTCKNVQNVAYGFSFSSYARMYLHRDNDASCILPSPREHHFLGFSCRDGIDFSLLNPSITHLHVQISHRELSWLAALHERLSNLTHLAISLPSTAVTTWATVVPKISTILSENSGLEVLFVQVARSSSAGGVDPTETRTGDNRLVVFHAPMSCVAQWERTLSSSVGGFWREAERRVKQRASKGSDDQVMDPIAGKILARQTFAGLRRLTKLDGGDTRAFHALPLISYNYH